MPKTIVFDDLGSVLHFLVGLASVLLGLEVPATLLFILYQVYEVEKWSYKRGDYIEYLSGLLLGGVLKRLVIGIP